MKRAQIQFGESLMVIVILVFLLIIGLVFYAYSREGSIKTETSFREDVKAITLARNVLALPELECSRRSGRSAGCVDVQKIDALRQLLSTRDTIVWPYYRDLFGYATIKIGIITQDGNVIARPPLGLYDYPPVNITGWQRSNQFIFTTLYDPMNEEHRLAYFNVTRYSKGVGS